MTSNEAIERALRRIDPDVTREEATALRTALLVSIQSSLRKVAELLSTKNEEDQERQLLEVTDTSSVSLVNGVADLTPLITANFLVDTINFGEIFHASSIYPLQQLPDQGSLQHPWAKFFIYYAIQGNTLKTRDVTGDNPLTNLNGALTITAVQVPTLANLPKQLEYLLIDLMVAEISAQPKTTKTKRQEPAAA